jgi:hypothetical protein
MSKWYVYTNLRDHRVYVSDGWYAETPLRTAEGLLWDRPERIPKFVQELAYRATGLKPI